VKGILVARWGVISLNIMTSVFLCLMRIRLRSAQFWQASIIDRGERFFLFSRISFRVGRIAAALRSRSSFGDFVCSHILVSRSGMPVVVRKIGDFYQVGDGRGKEKKCKSCCGLCVLGISGLVFRQWLGEWGAESARS